MNLFDYTCMVIIFFILLLACFVRFNRIDSKLDSIKTVLEAPYQDPNSLKHKILMLEEENNNLKEALEYIKANQRVDADMVMPTLYGKKEINENQNTLC